MNKKNEIRADFILQNSWDPASCPWSTQSQCTLLLKELKPGENLKTTHSHQFPKEQRTWAQPPASAWLFRHWAQKSGLLSFCCYWCIRGLWQGSSQYNHCKDDSGWHHASWYFNCACEIAKNMASGGCTEMGWIVLHINAGYELLIACKK